MENKIFIFCKEAYNTSYQTTFNDYVASKKEVTDNVLKEAERIAQKQAITDALKLGVVQFPNVDVSEVWREVYRVHIYRKSGLSVDEETVAKVISADNSWKKSSGHAFEALVKELANLALAGTGIEILLQKDLSILLKAGEIDNEERDIAWLEKQVNGSVFDLYAMVNTEDGKRLVFGCVQSKTSVRDRVTRDREPSIKAMAAFFWSICIALDGEYLKMPKFTAMVNGDDATEFKENGWHAMYVLSDIDTNDRLYHTDFDLSLFANHAQKAANYWLTQRQWFDSNWKAR